MINSTLYVSEMKRSVKIIVFFAAIITMYVCIIIGMYNPEMMDTLDNFYDVMPELMASVGMAAGATDLLGFMVSYLYGFILLIFPMVFCIVRGNGLIAKYTDSGAMAVLVGAPITRRKIATTQIAVLISGVTILVAYATTLEILYARVKFPGELPTQNLLKLNLALYFLQLFIASICFMASCLANDTKNSIAFGAGIPGVMYILQMLSNVGEKSEFIKYFTFFTLFDADSIAGGDNKSFCLTLILLLGAAISFVISVLVFRNKDLSL